MTQKVGGAGRKKRRGGLEKRKKRPFRHAPKQAQIRAAVNEGCPRYTHGGVLLGMSQSQRTEAAAFAGRIIQSVFAEYCQ